MSTFLDHQMSPLEIVLASTFVAAFVLWATRS